MSNSTETRPAPVALILGVTGSIGGAVAEALARRGYAIRALARRQPTAAPSFAVDWRIGDALDPEAVASAANGASIIVHGVNPPGYLNWREHGIPMLANTVAAARSSGATILFPGNVYVYGPATPAIVDEATQFDARSAKGRVRLEMEAMLADAANEGVRSIILRAGDFFGPGVANSWFSQGIASGGRDARRLIDPTIGRAGHAWAYVPDLAETFARLADRREQLPPFATFHFGGHWLADGRDMARATRLALGRPDIGIHRFPWFLLPVLGLFSPFMREVKEMVWLWRQPLRLDNGKLESLIGPEPHTPLADALAAALGPKEPQQPAMAHARTLPAS